MMTYKINSQEGRKVNVTLDFGNGETKTKDMDIQPVGYDVIDSEGRRTLAFKDPFDDIDTFFKGHMESYVAGKAAASVPVLEARKAIDPVASLATKALAREAAILEEAGPIAEEVPLEPVA